MTIVLTPKKILNVEGPLIYLAGPVQGAPPWQIDAISVLQAFAPDLAIANPRTQHFDGKFEAQMQWETHYLERSARDGVLLFWLARETEHRCNRAYAQAIRFELGEWAARSRAGLARVVVGIERGFTGGPYLRRRLQLAYPNIPVCSTLRLTCIAATELARAAGPQFGYPVLQPPTAGLPPLDVLVQRPRSLQDP